MRLSVIVPSYNQGRFLAECIGSVVRQLEPEDELLVVDGGSTDESVEVIRKFERRITRWVSERDRGQAHAVNKGVGWATGDIIVWINSDDALMPGALDALRETWQPGSGLVIFDAVWIDETCTRATVFPAPRRLSLDLFADGVMPINQPCTILSREDFRRLGGLDESLHFALDYDLFVRALQAGLVATLVPRLFAVNRLHGATKTSSGKLPAELGAAARRHFGLAARPYPAGLLGKFGFKIFTLFPLDFALRVLLKRLLGGVQLPGGIVFGLTGRVRQWLAEARACMSWPGA